ncbi:AP complex, mu/sigma subunit [Crepidotus variabilis]|uniref:AP complex subunit sigma n=1 Tax=Crepidotus variabilis TaxID=179855 RepID=A0A9P6EVT8_9AGAR|nr:AP complex, mu/sigma subunit [Crepidotus variabilis]
MINYLLLVSRQGKLRLQKWYITLTVKEKAKVIKEVTALALGRRAKMCNFLEYKGRKVVYRRYASLFFICEIDENDNELFTLEVVHRYVESLDRYFGNVCELDLIFNFQQAYAVLDELVIAGELQEPSRRVAFHSIKASDATEQEDELTSAIKAANLL